MTPAGRPKIVSGADDGGVGAGYVLADIAGSNAEVKNP
jgi:hypothetical protein